MSELPNLLVAGVLLLLLFVGTFIFRRIHVPGILAYILLGMVLAGWLHGNHLLEFVGEVGIVLLFFLLGMEFPFSRLVEMAKRGWSGGLLDFFFNFLLTLFIVLLFQVDGMTAFIIASFVYATSSSITAKLMEEHKRFANVEADYIMGILIFEDLLAPILIAFLAGLQDGDSLRGSFLALLGLKMLLLIAGAIVLGHFGFRALHNFVERYLEEDFFPLFAGGVALAYAGLSLYLGVSEILGAFLAGMMMAETRRSEEVEGLLSPVQNLVLPVFFLSFGAGIQFDQGVNGTVLLLLSVLVVWSIVGKMAAGYLGARIYGLSHRVSLRAAMSITSRGEFSAVVVSFTQGGLQVLGGLYILLTSLLGSILFQQAPTLAKRWSRSPQSAAQKGKSPL